MPRFQFASVVWGSEFTDAFTRICLPSQLSPRNLPSFLNVESRYSIYTTRRDAGNIRRSESYRTLAEIMPVDLFYIEGIARVGKYQAMNQCHAHFIRSTALENSSLIFLGPDVVWSDGSFARLLDLHDTGIRNVAIGSVRLTKETFIPALLEKHGKGGVFESITAPQLVRLALDHLHPVTRAQLWSPTNQSNFPQGELFWPVGNEGLVARRFQFHPLMITPAERKLLPSIAVDADFTDNACPKATDWYVVCDSSDICGMDFTPAAYGQRHTGGWIRPGKPSVAEEAKWAREHIRGIYRHFVSHKIRFHAEDCSAAWEAIERQSDVVIDSILELVDRNDGPGEPARPSRLRYLSPRFWLSRQRQAGTRSLCKELYTRGRQAALRCLWGTELTIRAADQQ